MRMQQMEVGVFLSSTGISDPFEATSKLGELGIKSAQVGFQPPEFYTSENAQKLKVVRNKIRRLKRKLRMAAV